MMNGGRGELLITINSNNYTGSIGAGAWYWASKIEFQMQVTKGVLIKVGAYASLLQAGAESVIIHFSLLIKVVGIRSITNLFLNV